jgi:hypothetical protein
MLLIIALACAAFALGILVRSRIAAHRRADAGRLGDRLRSL